MENFFKNTKSMDYLQLLVAFYTCCHTVIKTRENTDIAHYKCAQMELQKKKKNYLVTTKFI